MKRVPCWLVATALLLLALNAVAQPTPIFTETTPFTSGQEGYNTYRIPAIVRSLNGTLLAFCEGRKTSAADSGDIDIVLKRSTNNGATWRPLALVQEEGGTAAITIGNPAPVVDEATGYIHLLFCRNNDRVFHTVSTDDGVTWSARDEITAQVKLANWGWYATGPGHGVQLKRGAQAGRLVVPCDHITTNSIYGSQVVYSDDHGNIWQLGASQDAASGVSPNENQTVELVAPSPSGGSRLCFAARNQSGAGGLARAQAWSTNGGAGYVGPFTNNPALVCPVVQGSVLRLRATDEGAGTNRLLFSCPNDTASRVNVSIWSSTNEAVTWGLPKSVYAGPSAYSDLVRDSNGDIGLLYEKGGVSAYETITYCHCNEAWLDAPVPVPPTEAPVPGFWNFEEKTAGQVCDTNAGAMLDVSPAGYGLHLTAQAAFAYVAGPTNYGSGTALHFDGTGGLQLSDAASSNHLDFGSNMSFTIEAVFRVASGYASVGSLVAKDYGSVLPSWWLRVESGRLRFLVSDTSVEAYLSSTNVVNDGQWHHVAAVRDATNPTNKVLRLWLDGVLNTNRADATTGSLANAQPFNIGRFGASSTRNLIGDIDMVRLTPQALASSQFLGKYTQFDADGDLIPDTFERAQCGTLALLGTGDYDADGSSDLLEFAFGSNPLDSNSQPSVQVIPAATSVQVNTTQRTLPPWLAIRLESSTNLVSWQTAAGTATITTLGGGLYQRSQTVPYPSGVPAGLFFRFRISQLP